MSSLAERLAAARKQTEPGAGPPPPPAPAGKEGAEPATQSAPPPRAPGGSDPADAEGGLRSRAAAASTSRVNRRGNAEFERLEELKHDVHTELLKQLGPQLYDANLDQAELDHRVRAVLAQLMSSQERPISNADRNRLTQEISDDILGYGPIEPFLRDIDVSEVMVNGPDSVYLETRRQAGQGQRPLQRRGTRPPHHRQDRLPHRPSRRRVQPDGRRAAP